MKNLALAVSLILSSVCWFAEAQTCAPLTVAPMELGNLESIGLLEFSSKFKAFREINLSKTSLCSERITFKAFTSDVDFVRMQRSTVKIDIAVLAEIGAFASLHNPSNEQIFRNEQLISSLMGVMTFISYANTDQLTWYTAEAKANAFGNTQPLSEYNSGIAKRMVQEKPLMALGLGVYRVLTFDRIAEDKKPYKQETHATPYQIASALVNSEHFDLARALLTLALENNYRLMDSSKAPEMTLEMLDQLQGLK